jgi:crotonobetainyl-CoA:carnitine CoA-transferase CaiB-like acyl-CoA transferase
MQQRSRDEVLAVLDAAGVPVGRIYTVADIASDPQYLAREMIVEVPTSDGSTLKVPGVVPKLSATPGCIAHPAPRLGEHTGDLQGDGWPARRAESGLLV